VGVERGGCVEWDGEEEGGLKGIESQWGREGE
jgi:hypothetical protein